MSASTLTGADRSHVYAPLGTSYLSAIDPRTSEGRVLFTNSIQDFSPRYVYVSPDGATIFEVSIAPSAGYSIASFDKTSGKPLQTFTTTYLPQAQFLSNVPFAISPDGTRLAVATCSDDYEATCEQGDVEVFDVSTGAEIGIISAGVNQVFGVAISPDSKTGYFTSSEQYVCSGCDATSIPASALTAFDLATMTVQKSLAFGLPMVGNIAIAPSGNVAYVGTILGGTSLFAISLPTLTIQKKVTVVGAIDVGLSANGTVLVATASAYNASIFNDTVTVLDPSTLAIRGTVALPYLSDSGFALDESGENVYLGNEFNNAIYQVNTSELSLKQTIPSQSQWDLTLINSGQTLCALQNVFSGESAIGVFPEGLAQPTRGLQTGGNGWLAVSPDGTLLYAAAPAGGVEANSTTTGAVQRSFLPGNGITSFALSPDGNTLYAAGYANTGLETPPSYLWVVHTVTAVVLSQIPLPSTAYMTATIQTVALSPDGSTLVVNTPNAPLMVFNAKTAQVVGYIEGVAGNTVAIDPSGRYVYFQNVPNGEPLTEIASLTNFQYYSQVISPGAAIAFSPVKPVVYVADGVKSISAFSTQNLMLIASVPVVTSGSQALAVTPDGRYLYAVGQYLETGNFNRALLSTQRPSLRGLLMASTKS